MAHKKDKSFFELHAHEYDILTDADNRVKRHQKEVVAIIERYKPRPVLDADCGSGLTTMVFAQQGVDAVGLDRYKPMLAALFCTLIKKLALPVVTRAYLLAL
jgi:ubiquinone/menaquinone biosynthesis C-methylase UbiE